MAKSTKQTAAVNTEQAAAPVVAAALKPAVEAALKPALKTSGFCIYIGPNLKGLLQTGTIFRGSREDAYLKAAAAIEKYPLVKSLIVTGDRLPKARLEVKTPGTALYAKYKKLAGK